MESDSVDLIVQAWRIRDPQLDSRTLEVIGRLLLCAEYFERAAKRSFRGSSWSVADFDVLNALRRVGDRHGSKPTELARSSLITTGAMTSRLDRLERAGLIRRLPDPDDRRGVLVCLTSQGAKSPRQALHALTSANQRIPRAAHRAAARLARLCAQETAPAPRTQMSWVRASVTARRTR